MKTHEVVVIGLLGIVAVGVGIWLLKALLGVLASIALPLAIVGGVGYVIYRSVRRRALPGSRRRSL